MSDDELKAISDRLSPQQRQAFAEIWNFFGGCDDEISQEANEGLLMIDILRGDAS